MPKRKPPGGNASQLTKRARSSSVARSKTSLGSVLDAALEEVASSVPGGKLVYKLARTLAKHGGQALKDNVKDALAAAAEEVAKQEAAEKELLVEVIELTGRQATLALRAIMEAGRHPDLELRQALGRFFVRVQHVDPDKTRAFEVADALARLTASDHQVLLALARLYRENRSVRVAGDALAENSTKAGRGGATLEGLQRLSSAIQELDPERLASIGHRLKSLGLTGLPPGMGRSGVVGGPTLNEFHSLTPLGRELVRLTEQRAP